MKRILFLMAILFCFGCNPEKYTMQYWGIFIKNNADYPIVYAVSFERLANGKYHPVPDWPADSTGRLWHQCSANAKSHFRLGWNDMTHNRDDSVSIFIFHPDTLTKYNWTEIKAGNNYLKRYDKKMIEFGYAPDGDIIYP